MKFEASDLSTAPLVIDATYAVASDGRGLSREVLSKLIPGAGNSSGIRKIGKKNEERAVLLCMSGKEPNWNDELDPYTGILTYYGDNKHSGRELHETPRQGNELFRRVFSLAEGDAESRRKCPVFLVFESTGNGLEQRFLGIAVPGAREVPAERWLTAIWRMDSKGRFQNYRAIFTILNVNDVDRKWLDHIVKHGPALTPLELAPAAYRQWIQRGKIDALVVEPTSMFRAEAEQLPASSIEADLLAAIHRFCDGNAFKFEAIAAEIWRMHCTAPVSLQVTKPYRDGGRDAIGYMKLGPNQDPIRLDFALEAKLYTPPNGVGVKEVARLISRLKHRQFGVLVTTSYVSRQAYQEIRDDGHPVVLLAARDIAATLLHHGISADVIDSWLNAIDF